MARQRKSLGQRTFQPTPLFSDVGEAELPSTNAPRRITVAEERRYGVLTTADAKQIASQYMQEIDLSQVTKFGLPEIDDRYHVWRVPVLSDTGKRLGEVVVDARTSIIDRKRTTGADQLEQRILKKHRQKDKAPSDDPTRETPGGNHHHLRNIIALGEAATVLQELPPQSVDLVFTSPPYYNARVEYRDYDSYEDYLQAMRLVIRECRRVLADGRFFVMNISPVLVRRTNRTESSKRLAVPFDMHAIFTSEGYEFVDDIHWVKPEGAGWATGRGRRFAADRNPLQYKPVPVTEYVLVYRKQTARLIDWNIRQHPRLNDVAESKIIGDYDVTNLWRIKPRHTPDHPAVFPTELASKVIRYYSFVRDVVLDPFAGIGTTGEAAASSGRKFVLIEAQSQYVKTMVDNYHTWGDLSQDEILFVNYQPEQERLL